MLRIENCLILVWKGEALTFMKGNDEDTWFRL
jgi:hypothetical protein